MIHDDRLLRAAVVLFGRSERVGAEYPQCMLRVARFRGIARTDDFLDNRQFHANAFTLLGSAERFFREGLPIAGRIEPDLFERVDDPLYPPPALGEALANAICHRDYSIGGGSVAAAIYDDRLEVTSSGRLHFGLTPEALFEPHESLPWTPLIARVFYLRGIIEQWGRGTIKMRELTASAGLPAPEIEDAGGCVTVRFRPGTYVPSRVEREVTDRQQAILALLSGSVRRPCPSAQHEDNCGSPGGRLRVVDEVRGRPGREVAAIHPAGGLRRPRRGRAGERPGSGAMRAPPAAPAWLAGSGVGAVLDGQAALREQRGHKVRSPRIMQFHSM